jgi:hypothetical protein
MKIPVELICWSSGAALGILALWFAYRAMLKDRARGRRRCPKCWYDMSGTPGPEHLTCSECGRTVKREWHLYKTRRRWPLALAAILVGLLAVATAVFPNILDKTWPRLIPADVLILAMPKLEQGIPILYAELDRRMAAGELSKRQWRWLIKRAVEDPMKLVSIEVRSREKWPVESQPRFTADVQRQWSGRTWFNSLPMVIDIVSRQPRGETLQALCDRPRECTLQRNGASLQPWFVQTCALGEFTESAGKAAFDISVRVEVATSSTSSWVEIARGKTELSLRKEGHLQDDMEPFRSPELDYWLGRNMSCTANSRGIWIKVLGSAQCPLKNPITVAGHAELVCGDNVLVATDVIETQRYVRKWMDNPGTMTMLGGIWEKFDQPSQAMLEREWTLRLRSSVQVALDDFASKRYWVGEVNVPLEYNSNRSEWRCGPTR